MVEERKSMVEVDFDKYAEEKIKKLRQATVQSQLQILENIVEELEITVIDAALTRGGFIELICPCGDSYNVHPSLPRVKEILNAIMSGKVVKVVATRMLGYKRLNEIKSVEVLEKIKVNPECIAVGVLDQYGGSYVLLIEDEKGNVLRAYFKEGTFNYEKLDEIKNKYGLGIRVAIIAGQVKRRQGIRGEYLTVRGFYLRVLEKTGEASEPVEAAKVVEVKAGEAKGEAKTGVSVEARRERKVETGEHEAEETREESEEEVEDVIEV